MAQTSSEGFWPEHLHGVDQLPTDSSSRTFTHRQVRGLGIYSQSDSLFVQQYDSTSYLRQKLYYAFDHDHGLSVENHQLDLTGEYIRTIAGTKNAAGLEWQPRGVLSRYAGGADALIMAQAGAVFFTRQIDLPARFSVGGAADAWQNRMPNSLGGINVKKTGTDPGMYFSTNIGDGSRPLIEDIPLFASGRMSGIYKNKSKITTGDVHGLFIVKPDFSASPNTLRTILLKWGSAKVYSLFMFLSLEVIFAAIALYSCCILSTSAVDFASSTAV